MYIQRRQLNSNYVNFAYSCANERLKNGGGIPRFPSSQATIASTTVCPPPYHRMCPMASSTYARVSVQCLCIPSRTQTPPSTATINPAHHTLFALPPRALTVRLRRGTATVLPPRGDTTRRRCCRLVATRRTGNLPGGDWRARDVDIVGREAAGELGVRLLHLLR